MEFYDKEHESVLALNSCLQTQLCTCIHKTQADTYVCAHAPPVYMSPVATAWTLYTRYCML